MKTIIKSIVILSFLFWGQVQAQDLISAKEAAALSRKGQATLISARGATDYSKVHALGAVNVDPNTLVDEMSMLLPASEIAGILGEKGVSNSSHLIIYDDGTMKAAGRLYWVFKYMGVMQVSVVDGGMKHWRINRLPVTKNVTAVSRATFKPAVNDAYLADLNLVKKATTSGSYVLLDVRSSEEYHDAEGRIPTSINLEYKNVLEADGTFKSQTELAGMFGKLGVTKDKKVIVYCKSSVRAGIVFLALKSVLEYPDVRVYDGAFIEWMKIAPGNIETE